MKHSASLLLAIFFLTGMVGVYSQDSSTEKPRRESEDPSYEPSRTDPQSQSSQTKSKSKSTARPATAPTTVVVEVQESSGPRVKYILDGKPVYEGDPPIAGIEVKGGTKKSSDRVEPVAGGQAIVSPVTVEVNTGPRVKYILDGKPVYDGDPPIVDNVTPASGSASNLPQITVSGQRATTLDDDLTADKKGTPAAAAQAQLFDEYVPEGTLSSKASKCYTILAELKTNVETISRCLDNRGKENARLIHASDEVSKNVSDIATLWPGDREFLDRCATAKRSSLVFGDELGQTPWKWSEVRWSFDGLVKEIRGFREYCRSRANAEPRPLAVYDKKGNFVRNEDIPDPTLNTPEARREAKLKLTQAEIAKQREFQEGKAESKDKLKIEIDK